MSATMKKIFLRRRRWWLLLLASYLIVFAATGYVAFIAKDPSHLAHAKDRCADDRDAGRGD